MECEAPRYQVDESGRICLFVPCEDGYYQAFDGSECVAIDQSGEVPEYLSSIIDCNGEFLGSNQIQYFDPVGSQISNL